MIDINDYNRKDLIASCLMEAANIMSESAGRNGVADRYRDAKLENVKKEIAQLKAKGNLSEEEEDKLLELRDTASYLKGAHGGNKMSEPGSKYFGEAYAKKASPANVNHGNIELGKRAAEYSKQISDGNSNKGVGDFGVAPSHLKRYSGAEKYDRSDKKPAEIHDKINNRAKKAMGESVENHLAFADAILDLLDD